MKQQAVRVAEEASHKKRRENSVPQALLNDAPHPLSLPHFSSCQYPSHWQKWAKIHQNVSGYKLHMLSKCIKNKLQNILSQ